jgi:hypothetical protein
MEIIVFLRMMGMRGGRIKKKEWFREWAAPSRKSSRRFPTLIQFVPPYVSLGCDEEIS